MQTTTTLAGLTCDRAPLPAGGATALESSSYAELRALALRQVDEIAELHRTAQRLQTNLIVVSEGRAADLRAKKVVDEAVASRNAEIASLESIVDDQQDELDRANGIIQKLRADLDSVLNARESEARQMQAIAEESAARYSQIVELTTLARRQQVDIALLSEAREHEAMRVQVFAEESAARHAQIIELTSLAHRLQREISSLNESAAGLQTDVRTLHASLASRAEEMRSQQVLFETQISAANHQLGIVSRMLGERAAELAALECSVWVKLGASLALVRRRPAISPLAGRAEAVGPA